MGDSPERRYAESADSYQFDRKDDSLTIQASPLGWDSEMVYYPFVFDHDGRKIMLYCGNGYGRTDSVWRCWSR